MLVPKFSAFSYYHHNQRKEWSVERDIFVLRLKQLEEEEKSLRSWIISDLHDEVKGNLNSIGLVTLSIDQHGFDGSGIFDLAGIQFGLEICVDHMDGHLNLSPTDLMSRHL